MKRFLSAGEGYSRSRGSGSPAQPQKDKVFCVSMYAPKVTGMLLVVAFFCFFSADRATARTITQLDTAGVHAQQRDLARFPMVRYDPDLSQVAGLQIGSMIPDRLLELPLWVVNDPAGRDTVRLRDFSDQELIVLDFWATWCKPCIESIEKWITLSRHYPGKITLLPVHLDFDYKALPFAEKRGWGLPVVIGEGSVVVNRYFFTAVKVGGLVLIKDGRVFAMPGSKDCTVESIGAVLSGQLDSLPLRADFRYGEGV